jgi:hypothetical protein
MFKRWHSLCLALSLALTAATVLLPQELRLLRPPLHEMAEERDRKLIQSEYGNLPLSFEANQGQTASEAKFFARGNGYILFLTPRQIVLSFRPLEGIGLNPDDVTSPEKHLLHPTQLRISLRDANPQAQAIGLEELPGKTNYFVGKDPRNWRKNVPTYAKVRSSQVYPGVDLVYYGNHRELEYDFVVAPHADPSLIQLSIDDAEKLSLDSVGGVVLQTNGMTLRMQKPLIYQIHNQIRQEVAGRFRIAGPNQLRFDIGDYDNSKPLIIDPVLSYATYLSGMSNEVATSIQVDSAGNTYITGSTYSPDFPAVGPLGQPGPSVNRAMGDAFVTKLNAAGTAVIFSSFLSGNNLDRGNALALDPGGNIYVTGETLSTDFPVVNPLHSTCDNCPNTAHGFVAKLNPSGSALIYSTYLAGSGGEIGYAIAADSAGNAYVGGLTRSQDFPTTPGAYQPTPGDPVVACQIAAFDTCGDGFVAKIKSDGSAFVYATYLGGSLYDQVSGIAVDASGNAYVTGKTYSQNFPTTPGSLLPTCDTFRVCSTLFLNVFVTKLNAAGSALVYSTYLAGSNSFADSWANAIAIGTAGNAYVTGTTGAADFPTTAGAYQTGCVKNDAGCVGNAFVSKLNLTGSALVYSTYLGGSGGEGGNAIVVDSAGNAYIGGATASSDFPVVHPIEACGMGLSPTVSTIFASELNPSGSALIFSTCLGAGFVRASAGGLAIDTSGAMYLVGGLQILGSGFSTTSGAFQTSIQNSNIGTAFVAKIGSADAAAAAFDFHSLSFPDQTVGTTSAVNPIRLSSAGSAPLLLSSTQTTGDFAVTNDCASSVPGASDCHLLVTFTPTGTGTRNGTLVLTDNAADSPQVLMLTGTGINPKVMLTPSSLTFGSQQIGTSSAAQNITLTNTGIGPLVLTTIVAVPPGDFQEADNCLGLVQQGANCTLSIRFTPTAGGSRTATILLTDNAQGTPQSISVSGAGSGPGIALSTTNVVFPSQQAGTSSSPQSVTITNNGTAPLVISGFQLPTPPYTQTNTCGSSVAAGASCALSITFAPQSAGNYPGAVAISDNVLTSPQSITLSGASSGIPQASLSSNNLSFGTALDGTKSAPQSVTLSNSGNAPLNISSIAVVGVDYIQTNNCGSSVAAGANCTINASYAPSSSGTSQTRIDITSNAPNSPQSITLSGTGTEFLLTPASGASTSQTVNAGQTAQYTLTLIPSSMTRDTVTLSCSGAPATTSCSVLPALQTFTSTSSVPVSVKVSTTARGFLPGVPYGRSLPPTGAVRFLSWLAWLAAFLLLIALARRWNGERCFGTAQPTLSMNLALLVCLSIAMTASACGGGGTSPPPPPQTGTPAGSYNLTVTAKSASSTNPDQSVALTLTVK